jgi:TonB family protein
LDEKTFFNEMAGGWSERFYTFQIDRKGEVRDLRLVQSCGHRELDEEAVAKLRRASPFPSALLIEKEILDLEVPILFKLEEKK